MHLIEKFDCLSFLYKRRQHTQCGYISFSLFFLRFAWTSKSNYTSNAVCFFFFLFRYSKLEFSTLFQLKMAHGQWLIIYVFIIRQSIVIKKQFIQIDTKTKQNKIKETARGWMGCGLRNSGIFVQYVFFLKQIRGYSWNIEYALNK